MNRTLHASQRIDNIQTPIIPEVAALIRSNPGTVSLGQGVVAYGPPLQALERITPMLNDPASQIYGPVEGIAPLREAIARKLIAQNEIDLNQGSELRVTAGSNLAIYAALLAVTEPGDEVILPVPYFFNHEMAIGMTGCKAVFVPCDHEFQPDMQAIEDATTPRTKAIITVSPNNPSGAVYPRQTLLHINQLCGRKGIYHFSDEAYEDFTYGDAKHYSPGGFPDAAAHTLSFYTLSKSYGFASWRIGYVVAPTHLALALNKILDTLEICAPAVSQHAAVGCLEAGRDYVIEKSAPIKSARQLFLERLQGLPVLLSPPMADGAFYLLLRIAGTMNSMELVRALIEQHKIAAIPGAAFGMDQDCCIRIAYGALERTTAEEGIGRLIGGLEALVGK